MEHFCDALAYVSQHDLYAKALQKHQPTSDFPRNLLFDYSFSKLFKALEGNLYHHVLENSKTLKNKNFTDKIMKTVSNLEDIKKEEEVKAAMKAHDSIISEYKSLIRDQVKFVKLSPFLRTIIFLNLFNFILHNKTTTLSVWFVM